MKPIHVLRAGIVGLVFFSVPTAAAQDSEAQRDLKRRINRALLYLKMDIPGRAVNELKDITQSTIGKSDAVAWLALSRAQFALRENLDEAGTAFRRAEALEIKTRFNDDDWIERYYDEFQSLVGAIVVKELTCEYIQFDAKRISSISDERKLRLLEATRGLTQGKLFRSPEKPFFLPEAEYQFGDKTIRVRAAREISMTADDIGATCADPDELPEWLVKRNDNGGEELAELPPSFLQENWPWLVLGGVAVIAGGTAAAIAASGSDSGTFRLGF